MKQNALVPSANITGIDVQNDNHIVENERSAVNQQPEFGHRERADEFGDYLLTRCQRYLLHEIAAGDVRAKMSTL